MSLPFADAFSRGLSEALAAAVLASLAACGHGLLGPYGKKEEGGL